MRYSKFYYPVSITVFFIPKNTYILYYLLPLASCLLPLAFPYSKANAIANRSKLLANS
ncbi:hypothetical protein [Moorena producens]|uniref:hypothetical protein n=1 Tax=Moorena producens TaxID=1155739 RepID=UPI003C73791B